MELEKQEAEIQRLQEIMQQEDIRIRKIIQKKQAKQIREGKKDSVCIIA